MTRIHIEYADDAIVLSGSDTEPPRGLRIAARAPATDRASPIVAFGSGVSDGELFADDVGSARLCYLPRYRLLDEIVGGQPRACVRFSYDPQGFQLALRLAHVAAPELGDDAGGAEPHDVAHEVSLAFTPRRADGSALQRRELRFHDVTVEPTGLCATLRLGGTDERDAVYTALTERAWDASLTVHRRFAIATRADLPLFERLDADTRALHDAAETFQRSPPAVPGIAPATVSRLAVELLDAACRPDDPRRRKFVSYVRVGLEHLIEPRRIDQPLERVIAATTSLGAGRSGTPAAITLMRDLAVRCQQHLAALRPALGTYETRTYDLPWVLDRSPFVFATNLYGYVFADLEQPAGGLVRREVGHAGRWQRYYQDWAERHRFYYLPDRFALGAPAERHVHVREHPPERYLLQYEAVPVVDAQRLARDADALARHAPAGAELQLVPLAATALGFYVRVPRPDLPALWERQHRPDAIQRLDAPLRDALALSVRDLATVVDAMFTERGSFFTGEIEVRIADTATEHVAFDGRLPSADRDAIWDAIYDAGPPPETTPITIKISAGYFARAGIAAIDVEVESAGTARLTADAPEQTLSLRTPLRTFVCGVADDRRYRYRTTLVPADGRPRTTLPADGGWSTATDTILRPRLI